MACNSCENEFQSRQSLVLSIEKSGSTARLRVKNQCRNAVLIQRILLCHKKAGSGSMTVQFLRPPPHGISWDYPRAYLESGMDQYFYTLNNLETGTIVQAQAEYIEIEGRSRSCAIAM
jgi:hypothetical protein